MSTSIAFEDTQLYPIYPLHNREQKRLQQAIDYLSKNYRNKISPEALSIEVNLSVAKLQAGFKARTGMTIYGHLQAIRVKEAGVLLALTDTSIRNIAKQVGFKTQSHFGEVFRKATGLTPRQYRNCHGS